MNPNGLRFSPATDTASTAAATPLSRFLPPLPHGMVSGWLGDSVPPGSWLLDPLGASPALALEAARAGYRVLVACNNPVIAFLIETLASAPKTADFQAALAELAVAKRGEERLEKHILDLYRTHCDSCSETVTAQAFLWRKGESQPYARVYQCSKCGESGERPVTAADLERLAAMGGDRMQRSRALQRVVMSDEEYRTDVEEALENYLPRSLYVLFTLLNKAEGLGLPPERMRLVQVLLLSTFDAGNTLWSQGGGRARPKQLTAPPQFRERNLWYALEEAAGEWTHQPGPVAVTRWPEPPPEQGGICLFRGRVKALLPLAGDLAPQAVIAAFPRPNQAFWTLSALWTGWLWGAEAALPLRNVLDRRRYDWNWHTSAVHTALSPVGANLPAGTPFWGILAELAPGFLSAVTVAAEAAGLEMEGLALREEQNIAQALWRPTPEAPAPQQAADLERSAREAMRADLLARAEPAPYLTEYAAGLAALASSIATPNTPGALPGDLLTRMQAVLARTFADRTLLRLYGGGSQEDERGLWWLASSAERPVDPANPATYPLADRVEMETVRFLQRQAEFTFEELERAVCAQFPGLLTPPVELLRACLDSYGELIAGRAGIFRMRPSETAAARKADLGEMRGLLEDLGRKLGFSASDSGSTFTWEGHGERWQFYLMASGIISRYALNPARNPGDRHVLVLPGSRARLLEYKLRRDPRLAEAARPPEILFLKFRHLRSIAGNQNLTRQAWSASLEEDPLTDEATQIPLFAA